MNVFAPVSTIMSSNLVTLLEGQPLAKAKALFEKDNIHHIPVVGFKTVVGILSKSDLLHFMRGTIRGKGDEILENTRLNSWKVEEIMQKEVFTLQKTDTILKALDIFKNNKIHCIPILNNTELIGIVTPHDVVLCVREEGMKMAK